jgi:chromosome partitioning protein
VISTSLLRTIIVSVVGFKGGITKTTLTANLAAALARLGYKVVVIETDRQGQLSLRMDVQRHDGFYRLIKENAAFDDVLVTPPETFAGERALGGELYLISASDMQSLMYEDESVTAAIYRRFQQLRGHVDFVLVDTSPDMNEINNAWFYTADWLILPTLCEPSSVDVLRMQTIKYIEERQQQAIANGLPHARVLGIVPNRYDSRFSVQSVCVGRLQGRYGDRYKVFSVMRDLAAWQTASFMRRSIYTYPDSEEFNPITRRGARKDSRIAQQEVQQIVDAIVGTREMVKVEA